LLCLSLLVLGVACKGGGDGARYPNVVDVSGGNGGSSDDDQGGDAGGIVLGVAFDGGSSIEVLERGDVDVSWVPFTELELLLDFGATPLVVEGELVITVDPAAPPAGEVYTLTNSSTGELFVSNGIGGLEDDDVVTGLDVRPGGSIEFPLNSPDSPGNAPEKSGRYLFSHDVQNAGEISIADVDFSERGRLELITFSHYVGTGRVLAHGRWPGQTGGWIGLFARGSFLNAGDMLAYGADADAGDGGEGGRILLAGDEGVAENSGDLIAYGGSATGALGGAGARGGWVDLGGWNSTWTSGRIDVQGGNGRESILDGRGGRGGTVELWCQRGDIRNAGDVLAEGGSADNDVSGRGGDIAFRAQGGEIRSNGALVARAGDATGNGSGVGTERSFGNEGGEIDFSTEDDWREPGNFPAGDILLSGPLLAGGGDGKLGGGEGGRITIFVGNSPSHGDAMIGLYGNEAIDGGGGRGAYEGGYGGQLELDVSSNSATTTGSVTVEPRIDFSGGDADPDLDDSQGGGGGMIRIEAATLSVGSVDVSGGAGFYPGADGEIQVPAAP